MAGAYKFTTSTTGPVHLKPVAVLAKPRIDATIGSIIQLDGRKSYSPEKKLLSFAWSFNQIPLGSALTSTSLRPIRPNASAVAFTPDKIGVYVIQLVVNDGELDSDPLTSTVSIQLSRVPIGENLIPDAHFLWSYISNFWKLVEDREMITAIWSSVMQLVGSEMIKLWGNDYNKSLKTIQNTAQRRWLPYSTRTTVPTIQEQRVIVGKTCDGTGGVSGSPGTTPGTGTTASFYIPVTSAISRFDPTSGTPVGPVVGDRYISTATANGWVIDRIYEWTGSWAESLPVDGTYVRVLAENKIYLFSGSTWAAWVSGQTSVFTVLGGNYGAKGRVIDINSELYTISAVSSVQVDGDDYSVVSTDETVIPEGIIGATWRIPQLLHTPGYDLEAEGVRAGDVVVFEVKRGDTGVVAELRAQVVGVDRQRLGFEFTLADLSVGTETIDRALFQQLVQDLKIVKNTSSDIEIAAAADTLIRFIPLAINLSTRPFTQFKITLRAKTIIHNKSLLASTDVVSVPVLQEKVKDAPVVLRENLDYIVESGLITFVTGLFTPQSPSPNMLWAEATFLSNADTIENNFGLLADLRQDDLTKKQTRAPYLSAVKGLIFAYTNGPTVANIRLGLQILMGLPFTEERGQILSIEDNFATSTSGTPLGRILIEDVTAENVLLGVRRAYFYPTVVGVAIDPITGALYKAGDIVEAFRPLSEGIDVVDYIKDPDWWRRALGGVEILKYFTFKVVMDREIFDSNDALFALEFIRAIKPVYTKVIMDVLAQFADDIEVEESLGGKIGLNFYDNMWGLEATNRASDDNNQGVTLIGMGNQLFNSRSLHVLRDIVTYKDGTAVRASSATGWNTNYVRGRALTPLLREGDLLFLHQGQHGAPSASPGIYEIKTVVSANIIELGWAADLTDPMDYSGVVLDADTFDYGSGLTGVIMRRELNPLVWGSDLAISLGNLATSASAKFMTNGVSIGDHLIIEDGSLSTEYLIDAVTPASAPPFVPPQISETQVRLKLLYPSGGSNVPTLADDTGLDFRVVRPLLHHKRTIDATGENDGSYFLIAYAEAAGFRDAFTPSLVGSVISVSNAHFPINDGDFQVVAYRNRGEVDIDHASGWGEDPTWRQMVVTIEDPVACRERITELSPIGTCEIGLKSDSVQVSGTNTLGLSSSSYVLNGPPDPLATPIQLGFKAGDKIRLVSGSPLPLNEGRILTITDPYGTQITVLETLIYPDDAADYVFEVFRRMSI